MMENIRFRRGASPHPRLVLGRPPSSNNMVWGRWWEAGLPPHRGPASGLPGLGWKSAACLRQYTERVGEGQGGREREIGSGRGAWVRHHCWESDSVGTSGRKGRESVVAFPSRMGTLGLWRLGVVSGVLHEGLARKEANCGGDGRGAGRDGSRRTEIETLADWAGLGRRERAAGLSALETDPGIRETEAWSIRDVGDAGTSDPPFRAWRLRPSSY